MHHLMLVLAFAVLPIVGCAPLPSGYPKEVSHVVEETHGTQLGRELGPQLAEHRGQSGFYPLADGIDAFVARLLVVKAAEISLDVQYYIWRSDTAGRVLMASLLEAAERGARVRVLLDDLDTAGKDLGIAMLDAHSGIEIRLFNPFANRSSRAIGFITEPQRVNRRMHNKSLTADNQVTIVGGRNVGNEYFGGASSTEFSDLDVLAVGPVVGEVSRAFDSYWNSEWVIPIAAFADAGSLEQGSLTSAREALDAAIEQARGTPYAEALRSSDLAATGEVTQLPFSWGRSVLLYDAPSKAAGTEMRRSTHIGPQLLSVFDTAQDELLIISPYFVPGDPLVDYLGQLVQRGVRVRVLTNSLAANDVGVVHAGYMRYRHALLQRGVELYEFKSTRGGANDGADRNPSGSSSASLHAKTFGIDRRALFVGSFNLDPRSVKLNTEMGVLFESPELAAALGEGFDSKLPTKAYRVERVTVPASDTHSGFEETRLEWVTLEDGEERRYEVEPETTLLQRLTVKLLSPFVIESLL
jgi:putative cardiolipin synthase